MTEAATPRRVTDMDQLRPGQLVAVKGFQESAVGTLRYERGQWEVRDHDSTVVWSIWDLEHKVVWILQETEPTPLDRLAAALEGGTAHPQGDAHVTVESDWLSELILTAQAVVDAR